MTTSLSFSADVSGVVGPISQVSAEVQRLEGIIARANQAGRTFSQLDMSHPEIAKIAPDIEKATRQLNDQRRMAAERKAGGVPLSPTMATVRALDDQAGRHLDPLELHRASQSGSLKPDQVRHVNNALGQAFVGTSFEPRRPPAPQAKPHQPADRDTGQTDEAPPELPDNRPAPAAPAPQLPERQGKQPSDVHAAPLETKMAPPPMPPPAAVAQPGQRSLDDVVAAVKASGQEGVPTKDLKYSHPAMRGMAGDVKTAQKRFEGLQDQSGPLAGVLGMLRKQEVAGGRMQPGGKLDLLRWQQIKGDAFAGGQTPYAAKQLGKHVDQVSKVFEGTKLTAAPPAPPPEVIKPEPPQKVRNNPTGEPSVINWQKTPPPPPMLPDGTEAPRTKPRGLINEFLRNYDELGEPPPPVKPPLPPAPVRDANPWGGKTADDLATSNGRPARIAPPPVDPAAYGPPIPPELAAKAHTPMPADGVVLPPAAAAGGGGKLPPPPPGAPPAPPPEGPKDPPGYRSTIGIPRKDQPPMDQARRASVVLGDPAAQTAKTFDGLAAALKKTNQEGVTFSKLDWSAPEMRPYQHGATTAEKRFQEEMKTGTGAGMDYWKASGGRKDYDHLQYLRDLPKHHGGDHDKAESQRRGFHRTIYRDTGIGSGAPPPPAAPQTALGRMGSFGAGMLGGAGASLGFGALSAVGAVIGQVGQGVTQAKQEAIDTHHLGKLLQDTSTDFGALREAVRKTGDSLHLTYEAAGKLSTEWARQTNQQNTGRVQAGVLASGQFSRGFGLDTEQTNRSFARSSLLGEDPKRFALMIAEASKAGGMTGQMPELIGILSKFQESNARQYGSNPEATQEFARLFAGLSDQGNRSGLGPRGVDNAAILENANNTLSQGGGMGMASQATTMRVMAANGIEDVYEQREVREQGMMARLGPKNAEGKRTGPTLMQATHDFLERETSGLSDGAALDIYTNHTLGAGARRADGRRLRETNREMRSTPNGVANFEATMSAAGIGDGERQAALKLENLPLTSRIARETDRTKLLAERDRQLARTDSGITGDMRTSLQAGREYDGDTETLKAELLRVGNEAGEKPNQGKIAEDQRNEATNALTRAGQGLLQPVLDLQKGATALVDATGKLTAVVDRLYSAQMGPRRANAEAANLPPVPEAERPFTGAAPIRGFREGEQPSELAFPPPPAAPPAPDPAEPGVYGPMPPPEVANPGMAGRARMRAEAARQPVITGSRPAPAGLGAPQGQRATPPAQETIAAPPPGPTPETAVIAGEGRDPDEPEVEEPATPVVPPDRPVDLPPPAPDAPMADRVPYGTHPGVIDRATPPPAAPPVPDRRPPISLLPPLPARDPLPPGEPTNDLPAPYVENPPPIPRAPTAAPLPYGQAPGFFDRARNFFGLGGAQQTAAPAAPPPRMPADVQRRRERDRAEAAEVREAATSAGLSGEGQVSGRREGGVVTSVTQGDRTVDLYDRLTDDQRRRVDGARELGRAMRGDPAAPGAAGQAGAPGAAGATGGAGGAGGAAGEAGAAGAAGDAGTPLPASADQPATPQPGQPPAPGTAEGTTAPAPRTAPAGTSAPAAAASTPPPAAPAAQPQRGAPQAATTAATGSRTAPAGTATPTGNAYRMPANLRQAMERDRQQARQLHEAAATAGLTGEGEVTGRTEGGVVTSVTRGGQTVDLYDRLPDEQRNRVDGARAMGRAMRGEPPVPTPAGRQTIAPPAIPVDETAAPSGSVAPQGAVANPTAGASAQPAAPVAQQMVPGAQPAASRATAPGAAANAPQNITDPIPGTAPAAAAARINPPAGVEDNAATRREIGQPAPENGGQPPVSPGGNADENAPGRPVLGQPPAAGAEATSAAAPGGIQPPPASAEASAAPAGPAEGAPTIAPPAAQGAEAARAAAPGIQPPSASAIEGASTIAAQSGPAAEAARTIDPGSIQPPPASVEGGAAPASRVEGAATIAAPTAASAEAVGAAAPVIQPPPPAVEGAAAPADQLGGMATIAAQTPTGAAAAGVEAQNPPQAIDNGARLSPASSNAPAGAGGETPPAAQPPVEGAAPPQNRGESGTPVPPAASESAASLQPVAAEGGGRPSRVSVGAGYRGVPVVRQARSPMVGVTRADAPARAVISPPTSQRAAAPEGATAAAGVDGQNIIAAGEATTTPTMFRHEAAEASGNSGGGGRGTTGGVGAGGGGGGGTPATPPAAGAAAGQPATNPAAGATASPPAGTAAPTTRPASPMSESAAREAAVASAAASGPGDEGIAGAEGVYAVGRARMPGFQRGNRAPAGNRQSMPGEQRERPTNLPMQGQGFRAPTAGQLASVSGGQMVTVPDPASGRRSVPAASRMATPPAAEGAGATGPAGAAGAAGASPAAAGGTAPSGGRTATAPDGAGRMAPPAGGSSPNEGLGALSRQEESGRAGAAAIGRDKTGGWSYGSYQIATNVGTMAPFMRQLEQENPEMHARLQAVGGEQGARAGTQEFRNEWKGMARDNPAFAQAQHKFIERTHYDPAARNAEKLGLNLADRSSTLRDVMWSTAVQHGPGSLEGRRGPSGASAVLQDALHSLGARNPQQVQALRDEDISKAIYEQRRTRFGSSEADTQRSVQNRFTREGAEAQRLIAMERQAGYGTAPAPSVAANAPASPPAASMAANAPPAEAAPPTAPLAASAPIAGAVQSAAMAAPPEGAGATDNAPRLAAADVGPSANPMAAPPASAPVGTPLPAGAAGPGGTPLPAAEARRAEAQQAAAAAQRVEVASNVSISPLRVEIADRSGGEVTSTQFLPTTSVPAPSGIGRGV